MTKSQHCATKLRIFSFVKVLGGICVVKAGLLVFVMLGGPLPSWLGGEVQEPAVQTLAEAVPVTEPAAVSATSGTTSMSLQASLPAPTVEEMPSSLLSLAPVVTKPSAPAAVSFEPVTEQPKKSSDRSIFNLAALKELPLPLFGSVSSAHAASNALPVPEVPPMPAANTFSPAEQQKPRGYDANVLGASTAPAATENGLPPRGEAGAYGDLPALPALPSGQSLPAPAVKSQGLRDTPSARAQELARQQQDILMLRQQMDLRLKDMEGAENRMKDLIREARALEDKQVRSLINIYSNMKPKVAAKALENMDDRVAVRILSGMPPKQAGEILTYTNPEKTAEFSELITRMKSNN